MKYRCGNDVTKISRFEHLIHNSAFYIRVLSKIELDEFLNLTNEQKPLYLAKRWALKEAYLKMRGWGMEYKKILPQITLVNKKNNKPFILNEDIDVSISHEEDYLFITCVEEEIC